MYCYTEYLIKCTIKSNASLNIKGTLIFKGLRIKKMFTCYCNVKGGE